MGGIPYWPTSPQLVGCDKAAIGTEHETRQTIATSQTISDTLFADGVTINSGVTVEFDNCWLYSDGAIQSSTLRGNSAPIVTLSSCTIGLDEDSPYHTFTGSEATVGVFGFPSGGSLTLSGCYGRHLSDLFTWASGTVTIEDSFFHDFVAVYTGVHLDAVQIAGGSAFIRRNFIDLTLSPLSRDFDSETEGYNGVIFVKPDLGALGEFDVERNYLNGGIYSLWFDASSNDFTGPGVVRRNFVGPDFITYPLFVDSDIRSQVDVYDNRLWSTFAQVTGPGAQNQQSEEPGMGAFSSAYSSAYDAGGADQTAAATLAGAGALTASATVTRFGAASLAGAGALTAAAQREAVAAAALSGAGALTASAQRTTFISAALQGVGSLTASLEGGSVPYFRPEFDSAAAAYREFTTKAAARVEFGH